VLLALARLGPDARDALPAVTKAVADTDLNVRLAAALALARLGGEAKAALPALLEGVTHADPALRQRAHEALRQFGPKARAAVPALIKLFGNPRIAYVYGDAPETIARIDPSQTDPAALAVLAGLTSADAFNRAEIALALWHLDRTGPRAVGMLEAALRDPDFSVRVRAAENLARIGADARAALPTLVRALEDDIEMVRVEAARAIARIDPRHPRGVAFLAGVLADPGSQPTAREKAAVYLGEMGPDAKPAVPALRDALRDRLLETRWLAAAALRKVDTAAAAAAGLP
jgi:HEAT repeat protein